MNIAYLILAHDKIPQLAGLINLMASKSGNYCYIHLDACMDRPSVARQLRLMTTNNNWLIIRQRFIVNRGGFKMIEATLELILEAINSGKTFHYFSLHSGKDLPLKTNDEINDFLAVHGQSLYLEYFSIPNFHNWGMDGAEDRINFHWFLDELGPDESYRLAMAQKQAGTIRPRPACIGEFYGGSQWWTLTRDCSLFIIRYLNNNPEFYQFFRSAFIPDELFFHTLLLNSRYRELIINDNLRMIDWKTGPHYPRVFDITDIFKLEQSESLFARKFDTDVDSAIIQHITDKLKNKTLN